MTRWCAAPRARVEPRLIKFGRLLAAPLHVSTVPAVPSVRARRGGTRGLARAPGLGCKNDAGRGLELFNFDIDVTR